MIPQRSEDGRLVFSISGLRTYGALHDTEGAPYEERRGCPLRWRVQYVDRAMPSRPRPLPLDRGLLLHRVLHIMERDDVGHEEAIQRAWHGALPPELHAEATKLMDAYMARDSQLSMYATLAYEHDVTVPLYVDPDHGQVWFRVIFDHLSIDTVGDMLHDTDYKSNATPPSMADCLRDMQLRGQRWALEQPEVWRPLGFTTAPDVAVHLDALRWRDVEIPFTDEHIRQWHAWAVDTVYAILRDEEHEPILNTGCVSCPIRWQCPAWLSLPGAGRTVAQRETGLTVQELSDRRDLLEVAKKTTEAQHAEVMRVLSGLTRETGSLKVGRQDWTDDATQWETVVDWGALQRVLGSRIWDVVTTTKTRIEEVTEGDAEWRKAALACFRRVAVGRKIRRRSR